MDARRGSDEPAVDSERGSVRVVIYAARSKEDTEGSIPSQLNDARHMAAREGWEVIGEYADDGYSAWKGNRGPALKDATRHAAEAARQHGATVMLLAQHSDRFARGEGLRPGAPQHLAELFIQMRRRDVHLRSVRPGSRMIGARSGLSFKRLRTRPRSSTVRSANSPSGAGPPPQSPRSNCRRLPDLTASDLRLESSLFRSPMITA